MVSVFVRLYAVLFALLLLVGCDRGVEANPDNLTHFASVTSDVCLKCHAGIPHQYPMMHGPVAVTACLWCHNPHESNQPSLLKAPAPELCIQCHDLRTLSAAPPEHHTPNSACLKCHTGHGGTKRYFLRPGAAPAAGAKPAGAVTLSGFLGAPVPAPAPARLSAPAPAPAPVKEETAQDARPPEEVLLLQAAPPEAPGGPAARSYASGTGMRSWRRRTVASTSSVIVPPSMTTP